MALTLTALQSLDGSRVLLLSEQEGWRIDEQDGEIVLREPLTIPSGSYEARARATTTRPGSGVGFARELFVFALDGGDLRAVGTGQGTLAA